MHSSRVLKRKSIKATLALIPLVVVVLAFGVASASAAPPVWQISAMDIHRSGDGACAYWVEVTYSHRGPGELTIGTTLTTERVGLEFKGSGTHTTGAWIEPVAVDGGPATTEFRFVVEQWTRRGTTPVNVLESATPYRCS